MTLRPDAMPSQRSRDRIAVASKSLTNGCQIAQWSILADTVRRMVATVHPPAIDAPAKSVSVTQAGQATLRPGVLAGRAAAP